MIDVTPSVAGPELMPANGLEAVLIANRSALLGFLRAHGAGDGAEDLLQELWLRVAAATSGPVAQPLSYLYRAANNLMLDRYRSAKAAARREQDWSEAADAIVEPAAERGMIARERLALAQAALDGLGQRAAALFRRHRLEGVPQRDLAREFGVSLSTVESDLRLAYRTMIELRQRIDDDPPRLAGTGSVMPVRQI